MASFSGTLLDSFDFPSSKQVVFHRNVVKKVPIGTSQVSCIIGMVDVLPLGSQFTTRMDSSEEYKAKKDRSEDMSSYLERMQCQCSQEQVELQLVHKKMYACYLKDDALLSLCLLNQERAIENHVLVGALPF